MMSFSLSGGVEVLGFISPTDPLDTYPVIDPIYGIDGFRNVDLISDLDLIPNPRRRAGMVVGISGGTQYYKLNPSPWNGDITDWSVFNLGGGTFTGGTVSGATNFTSGLTSNIISATTYQNLPTDVRVTGGTYSNGTSTFTNNTGGTFSVTGFSTASTFTGGTVSGATNFTNGLTANTISATTFTANTETIVGRIPTGETGSVSTGSNPFGVYVQGRYAYVVNYNSNTLQIFDVSNPSSPVFVGSVLTGTNPFGVYVQGRYAYVTNYISNTLQIFDVSNPSSPVSVGSVLTGTSPRGVYVQGRYAYVVNSYPANTLQIFDISNPSLPSLVGSVPTSATPSYIYVQGRYAYVINGSNTLQIFDISNPSLPSLVGSVSTGTAPIGVYVQGRYAYVTNYISNTLQIFDVSNPSSPVSVGTVLTGSNPYSVYVQGRYAYVVNYNSNTLQIFDVSNPSSPSSIGYVSTGSQPYSVYVQGRYVYVINVSSNTLQIFDISGSYIQQLEAGGILTSTLESIGNATIGNDLAVVGGLNVSQSTNILGNLSATNMRVVSGLTATTISATTYQNLPTDVRVTGGTYSSGTATFTNNTGGTFNVTGFSTASTFTGGTVSGATNFISGLTANTISATTYQNLPTLTGNYLPLSGGSVTGNTSITGVFRITGNTTTYGNLTSLGEASTYIATPLTITPGNYSRFIQSYYLKIHPEGFNSFIPYFINDIGYLTLRGGSVTSNYSGLTQTQVETIFDGSPKYASFNPSLLGTGMTLNISFGENLNFTNILAISFGSANWRSQNFTIELSSGGTYSILDIVTGFTESDYSIKFSLPQGNTFDGCRITFSNFFSTSSPTGFRIADISLVKFNSDGPKSLYVGRDGGEIYKQIQITGGTTTTPSYSTLNDTDTGMYFPTGGTVGFVTNGVERMRINSSGNVGIGISNPSQKLHVSGNTLIEGSLSARTATISGNSQNILSVIGSGNSTTSPLFTVQGSSGELFSVSDSLVGSLFSVNDISGLPIVEVFSDNTMLVGSYQSPALNTTVRKTLTGGTNTIYSIPTSAYTGAFFDYTLISSGSTGARAGTIMSIWSGSTAQFTETPTPSIGSTTGVTFSVGVSGGNAVLSSSATTAGWVVKTIVRSI